jgi:metal-responsive CopG/Arc/MetJ family transcriptional regulator
MNIAIGDFIMKTIQMTLDEKLIDEVDITVKKIGTTRSAFTRTALKHELENMKVIELEKKQIEGYKRKPIKNKEFDVWEKEQVWNE